MRQLSQLTTRIFHGAVVFYLLWAGLVQAASDPDLSKLENIKLTQLQYIGSHNSYKKALDNRLMTWLKMFDPDVAESLDYAHSPIETQLDLGLRLFEIDLFYDPEGDRYHEPLGQQWPFAESSRTMPFTDGVQDSAFKVMHVQDIDFQTHCPTLKDCLRIFSTFSEANPNHLPIILTLNLKSDIIDLPGFTEPKPFGGEAFLTLATEFVEALGHTRIFTPAELQGNLPTLSKAVETLGWPDVNLMIYQTPVMVEDDFLSVRREDLSHCLLREALDIVVPSRGVCFACDKVEPLYVGVCRVCHYIDFACTHAYPASAYRKVLQWWCERRFNSCLPGSSSHRIFILLFRGPDTVFNEIS